MGKVKVPRKNVSLDMTAMCDVGFLLLTFFILTTSFKPDEPIVVDTPTSTSKFVMPETDVMLIQVSNDGKVFFGVDGQPNRVAILDKFSNKYGLKFTDQERQQFSLLSTVGVPVAALKGYLDKEPYERGKVVQPGIPSDTIKNELYDWIAFARLTNPGARIYLKGDRNSNYEVFQNVVNTLQAQNINRFNLVTGLEAGTR